MHRFIAFATPVIAAILVSGWANASVRTDPGEVRADSAPLPPATDTVSPFPDMVCKRRPLDNGRPGETVLECTPIKATPARSAR